MTAINIVRQAEAVHIISDGVFYDEQGIVTSIGPKVLLLPHLNAVLALRGPRDLLPLVGMKLSYLCSDFQALLEYLPIMVPLLHDGLDGILGADYPCDRAFDLLVAGYSAGRRKFESYVISSHNRNAREGWENFSEFNLAELPPVCTAPQAGPDEMAAAGWKPPEDAEIFDRRVDGVGLLRSQRHVRGPLDARRPAESVGYGVG